MTDDRIADLERLAAAIRGLDDLRRDIAAVVGLGPDEPPAGQRGVYLRMIDTAVEDIRWVHGHLLVEESRRWAQPKEAGAVALVLPEDETLSGP